MSKKEKFTPLSYSSLKAFAKSPKEFIAYKERTLESTPAMRMGVLIHLLILEPHLFPKKYAIYKGARRSGKEWTDFVEKYGDKREIIKTSEFEEANRIADAVKQHPTSQLLIKSCNKFEQLVESKIEGIPVKGYVDAYCKTHIVDVKTCQDALPENFQKNAYNFNYNLQAAMYIEALKKKVNKNADYFIIAVEKKSPFHVSVMRATDDFINSGRLQLRKLINEFKEWDGSSIGYEWRNQTEVFDLDVPHWAKDYEKIF
tara:strand:+ start:1003 stop:1776 length:774 start_codon:yes stop_codon:yes gene_type:complete